MATATAQSPPGTVLTLLRARAWIVPWALLAAVVGYSIAGAQRGATISRVDLFPGATMESAQAAHAAVRCQVRHGFLLRVAITAQMMTRAFVPGTQHGQPPGATCQVQR
ncbi:hypothetical protein [Ramlibacter sp. AN1133]|uniref:hypothetical protein n=1 Tax=Ramlibacter sp. AN1133 TaxID=3133429 RepID=UPI0030C1A088